MKTRTIGHLEQLVLLGALFWLPLVAAAQTFTPLHGFAGSDGSGPVAGLILSDNTLYGTTPGGGLGYGSVFAVKPDGTGFTNLYSFTNGNDGGNPLAGLVLLGNTLYGTVSGGGHSASGAIFAIHTDGTGFTNLYSFKALPSNLTRPPFIINRDGARPAAALILSGNTLYGTASEGGTGNSGTVFSVNIDGTGFTNLYNFTGGHDGGNPAAELILSGNTLYGTASQGGNLRSGTIFAINTDGTGFTNLYSFNDGSDGGNPLAELILSGNILYGTAKAGGNTDWGTVFSVNIDGTGFTNLYTFSDGNDGGNPCAGLVLSGNALYGTTSDGGNSGSGIIFTINTDGTGFTNLYSFMGGSDGANPFAGLVRSGSTFYGTAKNGGSSNKGTVFSLSVPIAGGPPLLEIASAGNQVVLYWPASSTNYVLQTTTNLASPDWAAVSNSMPIIGVTLTNSQSGAIFRLQQQ